MKTIVNNFKDFLQDEKTIDLKKAEYKSFKKEKYSKDQLKIIIGKQKTRIKKLEYENKLLKEKLSGKQLKLEL